MVLSLTQLTGKWGKQPVNKGAINKDARVIEAKCRNMERQGWSPEERLFPVHGL